MHDTRSIVRSISLAVLYAMGFGTCVYAQGSGPSLIDQAMERSRRNASDRVTGGDPVKLADNPWQVALVWAGSDNNMTAQFCGGSIIASHWVVTAAHCIDKKWPAEEYAVLSGTASLISGGVRSRVKSYTVHERYSTVGNPKQHDFDIAVLKIDPKGRAMIGTPIAGLSRAAENIAGSTPVRITGWGSTERDSPRAIVLQGAETHYVIMDICNQKRSYDGRINGNMLCAGEEDGSKDTCQGDSGGPATIQIGSLRLLAGITSWGWGCARPDAYGVYTRVSSFRTWIATATNQEVRW
jgi:secreted trypsin-like serine protease